DRRAIGLTHPTVPDVLRVDDHHGTVPALGKAPRLVDPDLDLLSRRQRPGAQDLDELLDVPLSRTGVAAGAHEHVTLVLTHGSVASRWSGGRLPEQTEQADSIE